jgi:hypothetical protein
LKIIVHSCLKLLYAGLEDLARAHIRCTSKIHQDSTTIEGRLNLHFLSKKGGCPLELSEEASDVDLFGKTKPKKNGSVTQQKWNQRSPQRWKQGSQEENKENNDKERRKRLRPAAKKAKEA